MEQFKLDVSPERRQWNESFRIDAKRYGEFRRAFGPLVRKYAEEKEYLPVHFAADVLLLGTTTDEIACLAFEVGRLVTIFSDEISKDNLLQMATDLENESKECNCARCRAERRGEPTSLGDFLAEALGIKKRNRGELMLVAEEMEAALKENFGDLVKVKMDGLDNPFASIGLAVKDKSLVNAEFTAKVKAVVDPIMEKYDLRAEDNEFNPLEEMFGLRRKKAAAN